MPLRLLRRSVLLQVATPLLLCLALAVIASAIASAVYLRLGSPDPTQEAVPLPWSGYTVIAATAAAATLLATASVLPLLRAASRPDALRTE